MNVRRLSLLLLLLCAGAAGARSVTGLSVAFDASMQPVATVSLEAGENGTALCDLRPCDIGGVGGAWDAVSGEVRLSETGTPFGVGGRPVADAPAAGETAVAVSRAIRLSPFPAGTVVVVR